MSRAQRAGPHEMLKRERRKFGDLLWDALLQLKAEFTDWPRIEGGPFTAELTTTAGILSVTWRGDWLVCDFPDLPSAAGTLPKDRKLMHRSGMWNFRFGRVSAAEALELFLRELQPLLPADLPVRRE